VTDGDVVDSWGRLRGAFLLRGGTNHLMGLGGKHYVVAIELT
jgi:hypothetical protein